MNKLDTLIVYVVLFFIAVGGSGTIAVISTRWILDADGNALYGTVSDREWVVRCAAFLLTFSVLLWAFIKWVIIKILNKLISNGTS